ncbi:thioredoxin family protein [Candidatus Hydrogenedentota bacterium]
MKRVQVLGTGCPKCKKLAETVSAAIDELGIECELEKVTEIDKIVGFGLMILPGLVVDGTVVVSGKVPSVEEIKTMLK